MAKGRPVGQSDILTAEELQKILSLPDRRTKQGARDYAVLLVLCNTPMRKGELVNLNRENLIDEGEKKFITYKGLKKKSQKPYWLKTPINEKVYTGIKKHSDAMETSETKRPEGAPLFNTLGKFGPYSVQRITAKAVDCLVEKYTRGAGIRKRITQHSFRASYLTLRTEGRDPRVLMALSGHTSMASFQVYTRVIEERKREAALAFSFS